jgi:hypothetical protein
VEHDEQPLEWLRLQPLFRVECGGDLPLGDRLIGCSSSCQTHVEKAQVISRTFPLHDPRPQQVQESQNSLASPI